MQSVKDIAAEIVGREGGYVNDPDDPGGPTKYGVTLGTLRSLGIDNDGNGQITSQDVKLLTTDQAVQIFLRHYFYGPKIDRLPGEIQDTVFDMQVNAGSNGVKILQRLCNVIPNTGSDIAVDGVIGPITIAKVEAAYNRLGPAMRDAYSIERRNYYFNLADRRVSSRKYARTRAGGKGGWIRRAEEFMTPKYRMTGTEFRARTAGW